MVDTIMVQKKNVRQLKFVVSGPFYGVFGVQLNRAPDGIDHAEISLRLMTLVHDGSLMLKYSQQHDSLTHSEIDVLKVSNVSHAVLLFKAFDFKPPAESLNLYRWASDAHTSWILPSHFSSSLSHQ